MTSKALSTPIVEQLESNYSKIDFGKFKKILIASSSQPVSVIATSIICRGALRKKLLFHVKFFDCITAIAQLQDHLKNSPDTLLLIVGLAITGKIPKKAKDIVLIGSQSYPDDPGIVVQMNEHPVVVDALAFTNEKLGTTVEDWELAAIGISLERHLKNEQSTEIITTCEENGLIAARTGFKIPGFNFLPMDEVFSNSIHPYVESLSGAPEPSQRIFEQADIPFSKWNSTLSDLTKEEARQLNGVLLLSLPQDSIPHVLGSDYESQLEDESSPLRYFSSISSLARVVWSRHEMGLFLGILIGDRARLLGNLIKTYREHCEAVTMMIPKMKSYLEDHPSQEDYLNGNIEMEDIICTDAARIILDLDINKDKHFAIIKSNQKITAVWRKKGILLSLLYNLREQNISCKSTSCESIQLMDSSEETISSLIEHLKNLIHEG